MEPVQVLDNSNTNNGISEQEILRNAFHSTSDLENSLYEITKSSTCLNKFFSVFYSIPQPVKKYISEYIPTTKPHRLSILSPKISDGAKYERRLYLDNKKFYGGNITSIITPTWNTTLPNFDNIFIDDFHIGSPNFNELHYILEVAESRILLEKNTQHFHIGQLVRTINKNQPNNFSKLEKKKVENYQNQTPQSKIPLIWQKREWDNPNMLMSEEENKQLIESIEKNELLMMDIKNWSFSSKMKKNKIGRPSKTSLKNINEEKNTTQQPHYMIDQSQKIANAMPIELSILSFETDDSNDDTDVNDFDIL